METIKINVEGMVCNGCENRIQNSLKMIDGVNKVVADHKKGIVTIKSNSKLDSNQICKKIEELGFNIVNN